MIRIAFPSSTLTPSISIEDSTNSVVSSGTMTLDTTESNGFSWYEYAFSGSPGSEYHIMVDGGSTLTESEIRYVDEWITEGSSGGGGASLSEIESSTILAKKLDIPTAQITSIEQKILLLERMQRATVRISGTQLIMEDSGGEIQRWNLKDSSDLPTSSIPYKRERIG